MFLFLVHLLVQSHVLSLVRLEIQLLLSRPLFGCDELGRLEGLFIPTDSETIE